MSVRPKWLQQHNGITHDVLARKCNPFYFENLFNYSMRIRKSVCLCLGKSPKFWVRLHYPHPPDFMSCGGKKVRVLCTFLRYLFPIIFQMYMCGQSIYEPQHEIINNVVCATSIGSDQPVHRRSLIRTLASLFTILWLLSYWLNTTWSF